MMKCGAKVLSRWVLAFSMSVALMSGVVLSPLAHAEAAAADPIDTSMRSCLARADRSSPQGQAQCMDTARDAWNMAIDAALSSIAAHAPDAARRGWQESHRRWLAWRTQEALLVRAVFVAKGSPDVISQANVLLQPVRDRALQLRRIAAQYRPQASTAASAPAPTQRGIAPNVRPCTADASCEHAQFDMNRYARRLRTKLPAQSRIVLTRAQRAWRSYFEATATLGTEADRVDLIGGRVATFKRLSDALGGD
jgi:uncharacterized protein YecT (DUF1311 family)